MEILGIGYHDIVIGILWFYKRWQMIIFYVTLCLEIDCCLLG